MSTVQCAVFGFIERARLPTQTQRPSTRLTQPPARSLLAQVEQEQEGAVRGGRPAGPHHQRGHGPGGGGHGGAHGQRVHLGGQRDPAPPAELLRLPRLQPNLLQDDRGPAALRGGRAQPVRGRVAGAVPGRQPGASEPMLF